jgi:hypothetical protein
LTQWERFVRSSSGDSDQSGVCPGNITRTRGRLGDVLAWVAGLHAGRTEADFEMQLVFEEIAQAFLGDKVP